MCNYYLGKFHHFFIVWWLFKGFKGKPAKSEAQSWCTTRSLQDLRTSFVPLIHGHVSTVYTIEKICQQATCWCWMKQRVGTAINIKFGRSIAVGPLKSFHFDLKIWTNMFEGWGWLSYWILLFNKLTYEVDILYSHVDFRTVISDQSSLHLELRAAFHPSSNLTTGPIKIYSSEPPKMAAFSNLKVEFYHLHIVLKQPIEVVRIKHVLENKPCLVSHLFSIHLAPPRDPGWKWFLRWVSLPPATCRSHLTAGKLQRVPAVSVGSVQSDIFSPSTQKPHDFIATNWE